MTRGREGILFFGAVAIALQSQVQLNVTWIGPRGPPAYLTYAWNDYPRAMPFISADGLRLPAAPFNATIVASA